MHTHTHAAVIWEIKNNNFLSRYAKCKAAETETIPISTIKII